MVHQRSIIPVIFLIITPLTVIWFSGCQTSDATAVDSDYAQEPSIASIEIPDEVAPGGALLWEQNCMRCHNYRSPASLSDTQWEIVLHHMRVRANLTAEEQVKILAFLKAAN